MAEEETIDLFTEKVNELQLCVQRAKDEMKETFVEGVGGAQAVKIKMDCCYEMRSIEISPEILEAIRLGRKNVLPDLQGLIIAAVNSATSQVNNIVRETMNSVSRALGFTVQE